MKKQFPIQAFFALSLFIFLCAACLFPQRTEAASYKTIYKKFLSKKTTTIDNYPVKLNWYYVINIDKKGAPELIVTSGGGAMTSYYIYTVSDGKLKYIGSIASRGVSTNPPTFMYNAKQKGLVTSGWINHIGGVWSQIYCISKSKINSKYLIETSYDSKGKLVYEITPSHKIVSKSKFNSYKKKYFKSQKTYKMKNNTTANLKESFG